MKDVKGRRRRKIAAVATGSAVKPSGSLKKTRAKRKLACGFLGEHVLRVQNVELTNEGKGGECYVSDPDRKNYLRKDVKCATVGQTSHFYNPVRAVARAIRDSLDPSKTPSRGKTLADMTPGEREELQRRLGCSIKAGR